eukprot:gb/GEZN01007183.1/.p1 GENE.gb/GEZN01007183.1/~~gb/GEZN01007183.1/.p1  ORF type:complete len:475 (+),score=39.29 gb/GEZN01007183.1/:89-1513(+)
MPLQASRLLPKFLPVFWNRAISCSIMHSRGFSNTFGSHVGAIVQSGSPTLKMYPTTESGETLLKYSSRDALLKKIDNLHGNDLLSGFFHLSCRLQGHPTKAQMVWQDERFLETLKRLTNTPEPLRPKELGLIISSCQRMGFENEAFLNIICDRLVNRGMTPAVLASTFNSLTYFATYSHPQLEAFCMKRYKNYGMEMDIDELSRMLQGLVRLSSPDRAEALAFTIKLLRKRMPRQVREISPEALLRCLNAVAQHGCHLNFDLLRLLTENARRRASKLPPNVLAETLFALARLGKSVASVEPLLLEVKRVVPNLNGNSVNDVLQALLLLKFRPNQLDKELLSSLQHQTLLRIHEFNTRSLSGVLYALGHLAPGCSKELQIALGKKTHFLAPHFQPMDCCKALLGWLSFEPNHAPGALLAHLSRIATKAIEQLVPVDIDLLIAQLGGVKQVKTVKQLGKFYLSLHRQRKRRPFFKI